jgi:hypothetical protein
MMGAMPLIGIQPSASKYLARNIRLGIMCTPLETWIRHSIFILLDGQIGTFFAELADAVVRNLGLTEVQLCPFHIRCSNCVYGLVFNARTALEIHTQFRVVRVVNYKLVKTCKGSRQPRAMYKRTSNHSTCLTLWVESSFEFTKLNFSRFGNWCRAANWGSMMFKSNANTLVRKITTANSYGPATKASTAVITKPHS